MKKHILITCIAFCFYLVAFSQFTKESEDYLYAKIDSLQKIAPGLIGKAKIDCLNTIVDQYQIMDEANQMQIDSAGPYARQAYQYAGELGYKRGLGYACLKLGYIKFLWGIEHKGDTDFSHSYADSLRSIEKLISQSMQISTELNDLTMKGSSYRLSANLAWLRGNNNQEKKLIKEAISHIERQTIEAKNVYTEMNYTRCGSCSGQEFRMGELYGRLGELTENKNEEIEIRKKAISFYKTAKAYPAVANNYAALIFHLTLSGNKSAEQLYIKEAESYFKGEGNISLLADFYSRLARVVGVKSNADYALTYFNKAGSIYHSLGDIEGELQSTTMGCASLYAYGDFENSLELGKKSIGIVEKMIAAEKKNNTRNDEWGRAYYWMARIYSTAGDYETGLKYMHRGISLFKNTKQSADFGASAIGEIYRQKGHYDSAMTYLNRFDKGLPTSSGALYLARLYIDLKQFDKAKVLIDKSIALSLRSSNFGNLGGDYTDLARIWVGKNDYRKALTNARAAQILLTKSNRNHRLIENCELLSEIFHRLNKHDSAYYYHKQYGILKDSLLSRQFYIRLNDYKKQAEEERKTSQLNLLNKDNQLKAQKLKQQATLRNSLIAGILLFFLLGVFVFRSFYLKRKKQQAENEKKQTDLEMQALRAQMNPHFIFNCLSSINRFILKNEPDTASDYLTRFSRLIRMVLINSQKSLITLEEELDMLTIYLDMERLRFKNSFNYHIVFTNRVDAGAIYLPPLLLQPFCENAIWHGLKHLADPQSGRHEQGRLDIELSMDNNVLHCSITDNGIGRQKAAEIRSKSAEEKKSLGLKITTERLALLNQEKDVNTSYEIADLKNENGETAGTTVQLKISLTESVEEYVNEKYFHNSPLGNEGIKAVIVDDEPYCCESLATLLERFCPEVKISAICNSGQEALSAIQKMKPQLVFLDIEMPYMNGFELLEKIPAIDFELIFTTSYDQYAIKAFRFSALDYLLKPVDREELQKAVKKVSGKMQSPLSQQLEILLQKINHTNNSIQRIALPTMEGLQLVPISSIISCASEGNYTIFFLKDKQKIVVSRPLKEAEEMLTEHSFFRVHHSYLVNMNEINKYMKVEGGYLVMSDGSTVDVSRSKKEILLKKLLPHKE